MEITTNEATIIGYKLIDNFISYSILKDAINHNKAENSRKAIRRMLNKMSISNNTGMDAWRIFNKLEAWTERTWVEFIGGTVPEDKFSLLILPFKQREVTMQISETQVKVLYVLIDVDLGESYEICTCVNIESGELEYRYVYKEELI
ncbi:MAG: hypothetical protein KAS32_30215 [Candidatus Peribacteraceae bacterium]|nr:hypothetical protein [Candidatus Peribacteraceae bacterium]